MHDARDGASALVILLCRVGGNNVPLLTVYKNNPFIVGDNARLWYRACMVTPIAQTERQHTGMLGMFSLRAMFYHYVTPIYLT